MECAERAWGRLRHVSYRFAIGVAAALIGLAGVAAGASAATLSVNTLADSTAASSECSGVASDCSLRQALDKARSGDTITFAVTGTLTLNAANGALQDSTTVTINGPGASQLAIDGGGSTQILNVGGSVEPVLTISGLTLQNGSAAVGGAIYLYAGRLVLSDDAFVDNTALGGGTAGFGGAIATASLSVAGAPDVSVSVKDSRFTGNSASATGSGDADGGAIYVDGALSIGGSTFTGNSATADDGGEGGAVYTLGHSKVSIANSTFAGNTAGGSNGHGGAMYAPGSTLTDDTIAGNTATGVGGGLASDGNDVVAYGTIFSNNKIGLPGEEPRYNNCIPSLANARSTTSYNLEGPGGGCTQPGPALDPMLGPLANNGGPTLTEAITPSSPAYGGVPAAACHSAPFLQVDQRGLPRPGNGETNCDIGAYEFQASSTVTSLASSANPSTAGAQVSFTAAVSPTPDGGTIAFTDGGIVIGGCDAVPVSLTGQASCQVTYPVAGSHSIVAAYSGDPAFASSASPTLEEVVQPAQSAASAPPTQSVSPTQSAPPTQPAPAVSPGSPARGSAGNVRVSGRHVTASVTCKGASGSSCAIKLTLSAAASHGSAHRRR